MKQVIEDFGDITGYNMKQYLEDFVVFIETKQQDIFDYYNGQVKEPNILSFNELSRLLTEYDKVTELIIINKNNFSNVSFWDLVDIVDDTKIQLDTVNKYYKWLRSSVVDNVLGEKIEVDYILNQNQTLEELSKEIGSTDYLDDWSKLSLRNDIKEEDYTKEGGILFKVSFKNNLGFYINSVVDVIQGESVYGKDLDLKIQFENNDLKVLSPKETFLQTTKILLNLKSGDSSEFPQDGIQKDMIVGNRGLVSVFYSSIFRQMYSVFSKDDTIKSILIANMSVDQDSEIIEVQIESRLNEVITQNIIT